MKKLFLLLLPFYCLSCTSSEVSVQNVDLKKTILEKNPVLNLDEASASQTLVTLVKCIGQSNDRYIFNLSRVKALQLGATDQEYDDVVEAVEYMNGFLDQAESEGATIVMGNYTPSNLSRPYSSIVTDGFVPDSNFVAQENAVTGVRESMKGQERKMQQTSEAVKVLRLLNIHRDERLTRAELKERLQLIRILQHVYQGDSLVFNPNQAKAIKSLPQEYVEYTRRYFRLMNDLLKGLDAHQKCMMNDFWMDYDITTPVMIGFLQHDTRFYRLSVSKEEILSIGVTEKEYTKIEKMISDINKIHAQADTVYMPTNMYREDVSSVFFPSDVIYGLDRGNGLIYRKLKKSFLEMINAFKKQFEIKE